MTYVKIKLLLILVTRGCTLHALHFFPQKSNIILLYATVSKLGL